MGITGYVSESGSQKSQKLKPKILLNKKIKINGFFCYTFENIAYLLGQKTILPLLEGEGMHVALLEIIELGPRKVPGGDRISLG